MGKRSLVALLATGIAVLAGRNIYAEGTFEEPAKTQQKVEQIEYEEEGTIQGKQGKNITYPELIFTGNGTITAPVYLTIDKRKFTNIDEVLRGGNVTLVRAMDPVIAIQNKIYYLENEPDAREHYLENERLRQIAIHKEILSVLFKDKQNRSLNYGKSLEMLTNAMQDNIIQPEEILGVDKDILYSFVKQGVDEYGKPYNVIALVSITDPSKPWFEEIKKRDNQLRQLEKELSRIKTDLPDMRNEYEKIINGKTDELKRLKQKTKKEKTGYTQLSLLAEANSNFAFDTFGGALGVRLTPFKDKNIGLGALFDFNFSLDKAIDSYTDSLSAGRTAYGTINDTDANSIGLLAELQYGPLFIGGGINYQNWITSILEQILDASGNVVKSNTNSTPNRQVFGKIYGGAEVQPVDGWKIGATVGYDGKNGAYFGLRNTVQIEDTMNAKRKENKNADKIKNYRKG